MFTDEEKDEFLMDVEATNNKAKVFVNDTSSVRTRIAREIKADGYISIAGGWRDYNYAGFTETGLQFWNAGGYVGAARAKAKAWTKEKRKISEERLFKIIAAILGMTMAIYGFISLWRKLR